MNIINLVDSFSKVNFGIWNSAVSTVIDLKEKFGADSFFYYDPSNEDFIPEFVRDKVFPFTSLRDILKNNLFLPENTIFVSHGCWRYPSKVGFEAVKKGFKWVYVPHGMLEPWSLKQNKLLKFFYFNIFEKRYAYSSSAIRSVSEPEKTNLENLIGRKVFRIYNGVPENNSFTIKDFDKIRVLFMGRLHHKKGILPLVEGWLKSRLYKNERFELLIAGPNDGELQKLKKTLEKFPEANIRFLGPIYGKEKEELLNISHYYVLPSLSEGFPTSVLEAMQRGLIPLISIGCNFPEVFSESLGTQLSPKIEEIIKVLNSLVGVKKETITKMGFKNQEYVRANYTLDKIASQQYNLYQSLLEQ